MNKLFCEYVIFVLHILSFSLFRMFRATVIYKKAFGLLFLYFKYFPFPTVFVGTTFIYVKRPLNSNLMQPMIQKCWVKVKALLDTKQCCDGQRLILHLKPLIGSSQPFDNSWILTSIKIFDASQNDTLIFDAVRTRERFNSCFAYIH